VCAAQRFDPRAGYVTIINTYAVAPERAEALLDFLVRATNENIRYLPGFVSAKLHVSFDRTQVVNYAQWRSREAIAAARENPTVVALMREQLQIADSFTPIQYELRQSVPLAAQVTPGVVLGSRRNRLKGDQHDK
jgi:quinol monooxygenase YgiN